MSQVQKLKDKLTTLTTKRGELDLSIQAVEAELTALLAIANVEPGDTVYGQVGKGDKAQLVSGVVLGVQESEKGKQIKVQSGTGFDTTVFVLNPAQVTGVAKPITEAVAEAESEVLEQPAPTPEFDAQAAQALAYPSA